MSLLFSAVENAFADIQPDPMVPRRSSPIRYAFPGASEVEDLKRQLAVYNYIVYQLTRDIAALQADKTQGYKNENYKQQAKYRLFENVVLQKKLKEAQEAIQRYEHQAAQQQRQEACNNELQIKYYNAVGCLEQQKNVNDTLRRSLDDLKKEIQAFATYLAQQYTALAEIPRLKKQISDLQATNEGLRSRTKMLENSCQGLQENMVSLEAENYQLREQVLQQNGVLQQTKLDSSLRFLESYTSDAESVQKELDDLRERVVALQGRALHMEAEKRKKDEEMATIKKNFADLKAYYDSMLQKQLDTANSASHCEEEAMAQSRANLFEMSSIIEQQRRQIQHYQSLVDQNPRSLNLLEQVIYDGNKELDEIISY